MSTFSYTFAAVRMSRDVYTLVTSGMSDLEMSVPAGVKAPRRCELILYCSEPKPEYIETMRFLAHFPHNQKTWIGSGHTVPNGNPPRAPLGQFCFGYDSFHSANRETRSDVAG